MLPPDGKALYVLTGRALGILGRDPASGRLTAAAGRASCLAASRRACRALRGVRRPDAAAVSPDGRYLYVAGDGLAALRRR